MSGSELTDLLIQARKDARKGYQIDVAISGPDGELIKYAYDTCRMRPVKRPKKN